MSDIKLPEAIDIHLVWSDACREWGDAIGGPDEYEIFAVKLFEAWSKRQGEIARSPPELEPAARQARYAVCTSMHGLEWSKWEDCTGDPMFAFCKQREVEGVKYEFRLLYTAEQMQEYAKQAAEMEWAEWYRRGLEQGLLSGKEREQQRLYRLVADDAWAITFQTFGQYRTALLKAIRGTK